MFDLVNTKNPSGGMIGPGNCVWFHHLMLQLSGGVGGEWYEKLLKNHAAIHDTFGFLINQHDIGPGYMYGVYSDIRVESQHWWNRCCFMGQLSGLYVLGRLMTNKGKDIESFPHSTFTTSEKSCTTAAYQAAAMMEELVRHGTRMLEEGEPMYSLPDITEYGVRAPFRFAVIGQTDSGKTYSIMR